jgi:hypothetical protein
LNCLFLFRFNDSALGVYEQALTHERDAQFELIAAILFSPAVQSFAELSLSPVFQRGWPSLYAAVERGRVDEQWLRYYLTRQVPTQGITIFAIDTSVWPRPHTRTLTDLRYEQKPDGSHPELCDGARLRIFESSLDTRTGPELGVARRFPPCGRAANSGRGGR